MYDLRWCVSNGAFIGGVYMIFGMPKDCFVMVLVYEL